IFSGGLPVIQNNVVHHNSVGISSDNLIDGNRVFANTTGILVRSAGIAQNNRAYSNQIGMTASNCTGALQSNVIYANTNQGILVDSFCNGVRLTQNTIF